MPLIASVSTSVKIILDSMKNLYYWYWSNKIEVAKQSFFHCAGHLSRTRIAIKGVNNHLQISEHTKITNYDIVIAGSGNSLEIENDCSANGNHVSLTMGNEGD
ncbi:MAG: hypothetical protein V7K62_10430 [Nostoc sp.]